MKTQSATQITPTPAAVRAPSKFASAIASAFRHPADINEPLTGLEITGMTFAGTTLTMLQVVINVFITYYYTNVVGLGAGFVGTLLLVTRIADGFSDLGMGIIITKTRSKSGQARPWAIRMALPLLLSTVLTFMVPPAWNPTVKALYACVTYFFMITVAITPAGLVGTVLGTNMTTHPQSRQKNAIFSSIFVMLGSVAGNVVTIQITEAMGDTYEAWRMVAVGFGLLAFVGQGVQYFFTKERNTHNVPSDYKQGDKKANGPTLRQSLPALTHNKYFIIMCLVGLFGAADSAMAGCVMYYIKYVLDDTSLVGIVSIVTLTATLAGIGLVPLMAKKIPAKALLLGGLVIKIVTLGLNVLYPDNIPMFLALAVLRSLAGSPMMIYGGVYMLNTIEYGEYKIGIRANHLMVSVSSVAGKIGAGLGGALIGWLLGFGGYDGTAAVQPDAVRNMIVYIYFLVPLVAGAAQCILLCFYDLDKKNAHILQTLKERASVAG